MKYLFTAIVTLSVLAACSNGMGERPSVGDRLDVDPTTAQPITTEPDTVGPERGDTTSLRR